jgi:hypothetical protein
MVVRNVSSNVTFQFIIIYLRDFNPNKENRNTKTYMINPYTQAGKPNKFVHHHAKGHTF